ncbi:DUF2911 domain-containing protein [Mucilaginibacter sp. AW1-3]
MKKLLMLALFTMGMLSMFNASAQDMAAPAKAPAAKKVRPSLPDTVKRTTNNGVDITIAYSQPSLKGRTVGKEIAPFNGKVWRTGANEATTIEFSKAVKIEGKELPAGKYGLYTIPGEKECVIIFNSVWKIWGLNYTLDEATGSKTDVLRITVKTSKAPETTEKLKFGIEKSGKVGFMWGDYMVAFNVK